MKNWKPPKPPFIKNKKLVFKRAADVADYIFQIGESPILRQPSKPVPVSTINSPIFQKKIKHLKKILLEYRKLTGYGRGIAAVQVGISVQLIIVFRDGKLMTIINPKITQRSKEEYRYAESCMSAYPVIALVARPAWIEFEYFNEQGKLQKWDNHQDKMLN